MVKIGIDIKCECEGIFKPIGLGSNIIQCNKCGRKGNLATLEFDPVIYETNTILERTESWISSITKKEPNNTKKEWLNKYLK